MRSFSSSLPLGKSCRKSDAGLLLGVHETATSHWTARRATSGPRTTFLQPSTRMLAASIKHSQALHAPAHASPNPRRPSNLCLFSLISLFSLSPLSSLRPSDSGSRDAIDLQFGLDPSLTVPSRTCQPRFRPERHLRACSAPSFQGSQAHAQRFD
ncbi:hypothetical protein B0J11DRAFT_34496 [Dendryphion nanum]|uniref:Uncharacterized protein n=1 Tax=Dendryphion nanum TaxID=256645 RepID=A0A9P9IZ06_9PLEO|nr:hypothetical protein B0J11DRAFT_34496 [Dendryphion nanum]